MNLETFKYMALLSKLELAAIAFGLAVMQGPEARVREARDRLVDAAHTFGKNFDPPEPPTTNPL